MIAIILALGFLVFIIAALWKVFEKAGQPGWAAIVPIYNYYIMAKMAEKPDYWTILMLIPFVNIVFIIWAWNRIVKRFGKDEAFTVGVILLGIVFIPILGFGDAQYKGLNHQNNGDQLLDSDMM
ncbi:MAG: DUF5684 domain-containing protein [Crocinitomicaceae bacterium]